MITTVRAYRVRLFGTLFKVKWFREALGPAQLDADEFLRRSVTKN